MLPAFGGERGIALDFCSTFWIMSFVTFRKNLRSPFQNNTPCCFDHCVRIPIIFSRKQESTPLRMLPAFGGERGIRTLVCLRTNWFRVSPVMTTSISLHNYDATACIIIMEQWDAARWAQLVESTSHTPLKIDKLACQTQGAGIFAKGEITLRDDAYCTYSNLLPIAPRATSICYHIFAALSREFENLSTKIILFCLLKKAKRGWKMLWFVI